VAIINDVMAKKYFGDTDPIGRTFGYDSDPAKQSVIIGVVKGTRSQGQREAIPTYAYYALDQNDGVFVRNLYVRTSADAVAAVTPMLKKAVEEAAPEMAVREVVSLGELTERSVANERMVSNLTAAFGLLGVAVAVLGLYGTIAYSVARRTNEIGVRLALGAEPGVVRWMVLRETLVLSAAGALVGVALTVPVAKVASSMVFGLSPRDPMTLGIAAVLVIAFGAIAGAVPAWRASRVNPTSALRAD
jgi:ABC-type antimicrobial peptide transport system permease subunit